jgi:ABC-2 type transport system permease protein
MFPQIVSMYVLFCMLANCLSILAPMAIAAGSLKPTSARLVPVLLQFALLLMFPIMIAPTQAPLALELLFDHLDWIHGVPVCLILALVECAGLVWLFLWLVGWQGVWLQAREQRILELVTTKAE